MSSRAGRARARASRTVLVPPQRPPPNVNPVPAAQAPLTITGKYRDTASFSNMLTRIGVTRGAINHLLSDDLDTMEVLVTQYKDDIKGFHSYLKATNKNLTNTNPQVRFSPVVVDRILAVVYHYVQSVTCFHTVPDIDLINRDEAMSMIDPYRMYRQFKENEVDEDILIDLPDLKGHENWITFRDKFLSNLINTPGSNGTPLLYIVDQTDRPTTRPNQALIEVNRQSLDSWEFYHENMVHFGAHYKRDNAKVWQLLKKSLLGTQPYHHIDHCARAENGRRAWESLRSYYEGEDYVNKTIQECLTRVRTMYYKGETPRFNFERFIDKQKECYKLLRDVGYNNGQGVDDASKCSNLKQMILPEAQLETALSLARTQGLFNGSFDDLVHFLKAEVDEITLRRSQLRANRSHRVSSVATSRSASTRNNRGRGGRGRGRSQNHNNYRNRNVLTRMVDGRQVHSGNYTPEEYRRLTPSQREAVKALRRQVRAQASEQNNPRNERRTIISGVAMAPETNISNPTMNDGSVSQLTQPSSGADTSSHTAPSGSIGSYLSNRRNQNNRSSSA